MRVLLLFLLMLPMLLGGCYPESLDYSPGWGTRIIVGTVKEVNSQQLESRSFIIVLEYYSNFVLFEDETLLYAPKARVVFRERMVNFVLVLILKQLP